MTRRQIFERVWGYDFRPGSNAIEVYIGYLRRKLEAGGEPRLIHTVRGMGYVLRERRMSLCRRLALAAAAAVAVVVAGRARRSSTSLVRDQLRGQVDERARAGRARGIVPRPPARAAPGRSTGSADAAPSPTAPPRPVPLERGEQLGGATASCAAEARHRAAVAPRRSSRSRRGGRSPTASGDAFHDADGRRRPRAHPHRRRARSGCASRSPGRSTRSTPCSAACAGSWLMVRWRASRWRRCRPARGALGAGARCGG